MREARFELGLVLAARGRAEEAIREFRAAEAASAAGVRRRPDPYAVAGRYLGRDGAPSEREPDGGLEAGGRSASVGHAGGLNATLLDYSELLVAEAGRVPR